MSRKNSIFDSIAFLALIGIVAGALGGVAIGLVVKPTPQPGTTSTSTAH
jgi:hypothetical protein